MSSIIQQALQLVWEKRNQLYTQADKLHKESIQYSENEVKKLEKSGNTSFSAFAPIQAEVARLQIQGNKLYQEANKIWDDAVLKHTGSIKMEWELVPGKENNKCILHNGMVFLP